MQEKPIFKSSTFLFYKESLQRHQVIAWWEMVRTKLHNKIKVLDRLTLKCIVHSKPYRID